VKKLEPEQLKKLENLVKRIDDLTDDLFYTIPLDEVGKKLRGKCNEIETLIHEIAEAYNIELD